MNIGSSGIFCAIPGAASAEWTTLGATLSSYTTVGLFAGLPQRHDV